jgi:hypothetical protein
MCGGNVAFNVALTSSLPHNITQLVCTFMDQATHIVWSHLLHGLNPCQTMNKTLHYYGQQTSPHLDKAILNQRLRVALPSTAANSCQYSML